MLKYAVIDKYSCKNEVNILACGNKKIFT